MDFESTVAPDRTSQPENEFTFPVQSWSQRLVIKSAGRFLVLGFDEIDRIEAAANYVRLHVGAQLHVVPDTIGAFEKRLPQEKFVRIHRSLIVNADRIRKLLPCHGSEYVVVLRSGKELPLGRSYRQQVERFLQLPNDGIGQVVLCHRNECRCFPRSRFRSRRCSGIQQIGALCMACACSKHSVGYT